MSDITPLEQKPEGNLQRADEFEHKLGRWNSTYWLDEFGQKYLRMQQNGTRRYRWWKVEEPRTIVPKYRKGV